MISDWITQYNTFCIITADHNSNKPLVGEGIGIFTNFPNKMSTLFLLLPISSAHTDINGDWVAKCCTTLPTSGWPYEKQYRRLVGIALDARQGTDNRLWQCRPPSQYSVTTKGEKLIFWGQTLFSSRHECIQDDYCTNHVIASLATTRDGTAYNVNIHMHLTYVFTHLHFKYTYASYTSMYVNTNGLYSMLQPNLNLIRFITSRPFSNRSTCFQVISSLQSS